ncbi:MAG TPA: response regulator transcription factor [candidate division Zixibacteria bacterium]|nr:response regulator transcription factor [candidate division Zixibacteria bacterium]
MKILVAEDDAVSRLVLEKTLQGWGHSVTSCETGAAAWALYRSGEFRVVISDWMMPEMDGPELCQKIRSLKRSDYTYVILLTAKTGRENFLEGMEAGTDDYLTKPFDADELKVRLKVAERILSLQADVQTLRGVLPICAWCQKIRDDERLWKTAEEYLTSHTDVDFSHSICPECAQKQKAGLAKKALG